MEKPAKNLKKTSTTSLKKTPSKKSQKTSDSAKISPKSKTVPKPKGSSGTTVKPKKDRVVAPTQAESQHKYYEGLGSRIAEKAYELYVQRGQEHGHDLEDWLEAERQILPRAIIKRS